MLKKRILIFNDCFYMGGTEILLVNLLNHLVDKKCDITLLLPNPSDKNVLLERVSDKVPVKYIFPNQLTGVKRCIYTNILIFYPKLFAKLTGLKEDEYDEIICFKDGFYSILFSKMNLPKYLWIHNQPFVRNYKSKSVKEFFAFILNRFQINRMAKSFEKYDRIICVSDSTKKSYIDIYNRGEAKREIEVLYNALDLSGIVERANESIDLPEKERFSFVVVIRLSHEKTVERVILATEKLLKEGYDFDVRILGDGAEFDRLCSMITQYGLDDRIVMHGRVSNPFPYMKYADWFLCPSSRESFALTLLESITIGTPVVTTASGGPEDVVDQGKYGLLVENSLEGVYKGMKEVMDNPSLREHYLSKRKECLSRFDYQKWLIAADNILGV